MDGFAVLAELDENHDGIIDENDSVWQDLRVWVYNGDGVAQDDEWAA